MYPRTTGPSGFTMIELLIVLAIGAILAVIAVPGMQGMLNSTRQSSALGLLVSDLNQARGEAIKRNGRMLVCGRNAAGTDCAAVTDWRVGWVVCGEHATTANTCAAGTTANPNPVLVRPALDAQLTLTSTDAVMRFNADSSQGAGGGIVSLTLAGTWSGAPTRTVLVAPTGSITKQ
jgi:prepilin-type N-terminal cleavage/methylation domain-containing protein